MPLLAPVTRAMRSVVPDNGISPSSSRLAAAEKQVLTADEESRRLRIMEGVRRLFHTRVCAVAERQLGMCEFARWDCRLRSAGAIDWGCSGVAAEQCPLRGELMAGNSLRRESDDLDIRINESGTKSTQLLRFLTFAIVGAATLRTCHASRRVR